MDQPPVVPGTPHPGVQLSERRRASPRPHRRTTGKEAKYIRRAWTPRDRPAYASVLPDTGPRTVSAHRRGVRGDYPGLTEGPSPCGAGLLSRRAFLVPAAEQIAGHPDVPGTDPRGLSEPLGDRTPIVRPMHLTSPVNRAIAAHLMRFAPNGPLLQVIAGVEFRECPRQSHHRTIDRGNSMFEVRYSPR